MTNLALDKVAWIRIDDQHRVLMTRNHGRDVFYFPGGRREPGETDLETLVREITEELTATIDPATVRHFSTFEESREAGLARMGCYFADHQGNLVPDNEIAELAWMSYADRGRASHFDQIVLDELHAQGLLV